MRGGQNTGFQYVDMTLSTLSPSRTSRRKTSISWWTTIDHHTCTQRDKLRSLSRSRREEFWSRIMIVVPWANLTGSYQDRRWDCASTVSSLHNDTMTAHHTPSFHSYSEERRARAVTHYQLATVSHCKPLKDIATVPACVYINLSRDDKQM